jgi:GT2 family glycosyltransferase
MIPDVAVVVPTFRRPGLLARCLNALMEQDFDPQRFEVIVVDDEPSDATRRVVELQTATRATPGATAPASSVTAAAATKPVIRYFAMRDAHGPAAARNAGWRAARAKVVAFTDDDCIPEPDWLSGGFEAIQAGADGASGQIIVPRAEVPTDYEAMIGLLEKASFVTANCFYRRQAIERVGGFDERFRVAWREDSDLHFRMLDAGYKLVEAPSARVIHPVRDAPWGISLREQRKSQYNALLYRKHPNRYRSSVQSRPPVRYYAITTCMVAAGAGAVLRNRTVAAIAGSAWLVQTSAFCLLRLHGTRRDRRHVMEMAVTSAVIPPLSLFWRLVGAVRFRTIFL